MRDFLKGKNIGPMLLIVVLLLALSVGAAVYNGTLSAQHTSEENDDEGRSGRRHAENGGEDRFFDGCGVRFLNGGGHGNGDCFFDRGGRTGDGYSCSDRRSSRRGGSYRTASRG